MNKAQRESIMVAIAAFTCLIVVLTSVFTGTFSWLGQNSDVEADGMEMSFVKYENLDVLDYIVYRYRIEDNVAFAVIDDPQAVTFMEMNEYDMVFPERNEYTPLIVKTTIDRTRGESFDVYMSCSGLLYDSERSGDKLDDNISNVINVKCAISSYLDEIISSGSVQTFYSSASAFFKDKDGVDRATTGVITDGHYKADSFVTTSNGALEKSSVIKFEVGSHEGLLEGDNNQLNVYFFIDYNQSLVERYVSDSLTGITVSSGGGVADVSVNFFRNTTVFTKDITTILFDNGKTSPDEQDTSD